MPSSSLMPPRWPRKILGNTIGANMMIVGYAYQQGLMPVSEEAIHRAIELNGVAVEFNKQAFLWGRRAAYDMESVEKLFGGAPQNLCRLD